MRWPALLLAGAATGVRLGAERWQPAGAGSSQLQAAPALFGHHRHHHHHHHSSAGRPEGGTTAEKGSGGGGGAGGWRGPLWFFAAHHKAGTNLLHGLASVQAHALDLQLCTGTCGYNVLFGKACKISDGKVSERTMFYCNAGAGDLEEARAVAGRQLRAVQIVRDPIALVVSGYVYDMHENDGFHANRSMRSMPMAEGLELEARFALKSVLPGMLAVYKSGRARGDVLVVRMEDFTASSESFDRAVARLYKYMLGDFASKQLSEQVRKQAMQEDLRRHPEVGSLGGVSPVERKRRAEEAMQDLPVELLAELRRYRRELGY